jgi:hypothetical protein
MRGGEIEKKLFGLWRVRLLYVLVLASRSAGDALGL